MDKYSSFEELKKSEIEGKDFKINFVKRNSQILIMAPHGGKIEKYTSEIAKWIANGSYSLYSFEGTKRNNNWDLHITSHRYNEPSALEMVNNSKIALSIHGQGNKEEKFIVIGGKDSLLTRKLRSLLSSNGFNLKEIKGLEAKSSYNICNRTKRSVGGQLEISKKMRIHLIENSKRRKTFVKLIRESLNQVECYLNNQ